MKRNSNHRNVLLLGLALLGGCRAVLDLDGYAFDGASTSATGSGGSAGTSTSTGSGGTGGTSMATGGPATTSASGGVGGAGGGPGVDCGTLTLCEGECADTANNPNHCGECGKTCPEGQLCQAGACTLNCAGGTTKCSGPDMLPLCADTANNPNHCGECGKTCPEGQLCQAGACTLNCAGGTTKCSGPDMLPLCADTKLDPGHCGGCGNICASANAVGACTNSTCTFTCKPNFGDCNQLADDGCEAFTALDPANCGTCGLMCKAGESCVSSQCEDSTTTRITGGERHSCALLLDGTVKCWGDNAAGKLGLGDTSPRGDGPGEMGDSLPIVDLGVGPSIASVASKRGHTCVLRVDGSVKCWGGNGSGQLGLGDANNRGDEPGEMGQSLPSLALGADRRAVQVATGDLSTCALLDDGAIKCWGASPFGQLGRGNTAAIGMGPDQMGDKLSPIDLGTFGPAMRITSGSNHVCALSTNGGVKCWGLNNSGQLGLGDTNNRGDNANEMGQNLPFVDLGVGKKAIGISAGWAFTCALLNDFTVKCWGQNHYGQLGQGDTEPRGDQPNEMGDKLPAVALGPTATPLVIQSNRYFSCARLVGAKVKCWGWNGAGNLGLGYKGNHGDGMNEMGDALPFVNPGSGTTVAAFGLGFTHTCAYLTSGVVKCWGANSSGQLGLGDLVARGDDAGEMGDALPAVKLFGP